MKRLKLNIVILTVISALMGTASADNIYRNSLGLSEESLEINIGKGQYDGTWISFFHNHEQLTNLSAMTEWEVKGGTAQLNNKELIDKDFPLLPINSDYIYYLYLAYNDITHVNFLSNVVTVERYLKLNHNPSLTNVDGLSSLVSAIGGIGLENNPSLTNVDGLSSLEYVRNFRLMHNPSLTNVDGLSSLVETYSLYLYDNSSLTNVDGLSSFSKVVLMQLQNNPSLTDISGLSNLVDAGQIVVDNPSQYTTKPVEGSNFCKGILSKDVWVREGEVNGPVLSYSDLCN